jgi:glycosyltransferase 2 family protein
MNRKRILILLVVVVVLGALIYLQIREWRHFDWEKFLQGSSGLNYWRILAGIGLVYLADFLRAVRWKVFLRPTLPNASWKGLISPQYVGFAGLALLGRPGEFVRPYLIARRENVTFASQLAIWFVERAFDTGAVTLILSIDIFFVPYMRENYPEWRIAGYGLIVAFILFSAMLWALAVSGPAIAAWTCRRLQSFSRSFASSFEQRLRAMSSGLNAVRDRTSFLQCSLLSLVIWVVIAYAYRQVTHAYPESTGLPTLDIPEVILLMGASIAGGVIQLPVVGGGSQLATIAVLSGTFGYADTPELAVSCGILLWLVTFMSVAPLGLTLARYEHLSIRKISEASEQEAHRRSGPQPAAPK